MKKSMAVAAALFAALAFAEAVSGPQGSVSSFATTPVVVDARDKVDCVKADSRLESRVATWACSDSMPFTSIYNPLIIILR